MGRGRVINIVDGRPELLLDPMEAFKDLKKLMLAIFTSDTRLEIRQHARGAPI